MGLNESKGNMYSFVTHTWNTVKGECYHDCSYCYMKRWNNLKAARFDEKELKTDLGSGNFIFVGSSNDLFADGTIDEWIRETLYHCVKYPDNRYFFQTKNPEGVDLYKDLIPDESIICITLESNHYYGEIMINAPIPTDRIMYFCDLPFKKMVTIEPILDFDLDIFVEMIKSCNPVQVNIGADSGGNKLPEPSWDKVVMLVNRLEKFTKVHMKPNIGRLERSAGL